ncbi:hypothetical protein [Hyphococcus sp.]|uniref:hypothetical protein n=1 Tax=Hyphococcus sp. TaxID=2038636 RepID=UPI0035C710DC
MGKPQLKASFAAALLIAGCGAKEDIGPVQYGLEDCRRVALVDAVSGEPVRGAEDLALDLERGRLFVSAYDRRAVEKAARKKRDALPQGGVYAIAIETLFDPQTEKVTVASLAAPGDFAGGLRPHGISYDEQNHELIFINRTYERQGRRWRMVPHLQRIGANGEMFVGAPSPAHCAANDVAAGEGGVVTTFDHASCGLGGGVENLFSLKRSGLADENGPLFSKAVFANGVARLENGEVAMAATREGAILLLEPSQKGFSERTRLTLPGNPDNVTISAEDDIIAALHPSLIKLAMARKFSLGRAPSRIVVADPETGAVSVLFEDAKGEVFSAATAAVKTQLGLVAGSVLDEGLLVCRADA